MISSATGGEGPVGGQAIRNERNLLQSSALYIAEERLGRSMKLQKKKKRQVMKHFHKIFSSSNIIN